MSALFGFWGPPDPALAAAMSTLLAHRGRHEVLEQTPYATVGVRADTVDGPTSVQPHRYGVGLIAMAGDPWNLSHDPDALRGPWVRAACDHERLVLHRDAAGARSIAWGRLDERVLFASEPKAIARAPGFTRRLRPAALAQYLSFSFVPERESMIEGVYRLHAGERAEFRDGRMPTYSRWWHPESLEGSRALSDDEWIEEFSHDFRAAVRCRGVGGATLSGGIDSSVVAAVLQETTGTPIDTYTAHFGQGFPNELEEASLVASHLKTRHHEVLVSPKAFVPHLKKAVWHLDDPIGDPVTIGNFALSLAMPEGGRIFNGEGGDPLFGGPKNLTMAMHHVYGGVDYSEGFRERAYLRSYMRAYTEVPRVLTPALLETIDMKRDLEGVLTPFFVSERPESFLHRLLIINTRLKGAHLILPKVERMMAANRITPVSPLFDERMLELSMAMPPRLKVHRAIEKVALKRAFGHALPATIVARKKSGMRVPVHHWFTGEMRRYARDILSPRSLKASGLFCPERVKQWLDYDIEEGVGRYGLRLWMLVTFEVWRRTLLD
ncbi:MAG: asparagine synthase-related protein [Myxococcota bacterium]